MTNRNIEDKMNDTNKDDPYEVEKCGKWINERNLNKV